MKIIYLNALLVLLLCNSAFAQTSLRGVYIDHFDDILGNNVKEDSLLHYMQDSSFNYLALYSLGNLNLHNSNTANGLGVFIKRARENFGIQYVGAVCESYSTFRDDIAPYNDNRTDDNERFNVFNLEFEFWTSSSVNPGGYYCTRYLQSANCSCDSSGGFKFFIKQMHLIDSLAAVQQVISETYLGWFNKGQAQQIQQNVDRILLHAYRTNTSSLFSYSKTRLQYLASNNSNVDIAPIFSAEPIFMGPWLETHSQLEAFNQYQTDFDNDNSSWKQYINILGFQWFDWKYMPRPVPGSFNPVITTSGSLTICSGDSLTLTASSGDAYDWSSGQTTQSIVVHSAGGYTCDVTHNGTPHTTPTTTVIVKNNPYASVTAGSLANGQVPLSANATPGSGTITNYQWKYNDGDINGATSSTFSSVTTGFYSVEVINSYGCKSVSSPNDVQINTTCNASTPSGLSSSAVTQQSASLHWAAGQTGDSLIIWLQVDTTTTNYQYIKLMNIGQNAAQLNNLLPGTTYGWAVKTVCGLTSGNYSTKAYFTTSGSTGINDPTTGDATNANTLKIFPNPAGASAQVEFTSKNVCIGELVLMDINSRIVQSELIQLGSGENKFQLNTSVITNGIYFLSIKNDETVAVKRIVISH